MGKTIDFKEKIEQRIIAVSRLGLREISMQCYEENKDYIDIEDIKNYNYTVRLRKATYLCDFVILQMKREI